MFSRPIVRSLRCVSGVRSVRRLIGVVPTHTLPYHPSTHATIHTHSPAHSIRTGPNTPHHPIRTAAAPLSHELEVVGEPNTLAYRLYYRSTSSKQKLSPWHDIPLLADQAGADNMLFNYINEIPKDTRPKMEIATKEENTPIKQDIKKGQLRSFKYGSIPFNYGALPQTWENPFAADKLTGLKGDNDPVDVCEISSEPLPMGAVVPVKVLGIIALIDEGETDWKVIAVQKNHPLFDKLNSVSDLDVHLPQCVPTIREWFRMYKTADGKPENQFAFDGKAQDKGVALEVIFETHAQWVDLKEGKVAGGELWINASAKQ